jgi:hypothetical protein
MMEALKHDFKIVMIMKATANPGCTALEDLFSASK